MSDLRELFFETAAELVEKLNEEALHLEKDPSNTETARSLRRIVHTLKGDSAACGYRELSELAHEFEDVLALKTNAAVIPEVAMRAADVFGALILAYHAKQELPDLQPLRQEITRLAHPEMAETKPAPPTSKVAAPGHAGADASQAQVQTPTEAVLWTEYERLAIARAFQEGKHLHHVIVGLDPQCGMPIAARQMIQIALASLGEVLAVHPPEGSNSSTNRVQIALASTKSALDISAKCSIPSITQTVELMPLRVTAPMTESTTSKPTEAAKSDETLSSAADTAEPTALVEVAAQAPIPADNILRVDAERIDSVLNLVGELILAKSMLQQTLSEFGQRFPKDPLRGRFSDVMAFQSRVLGDLQHSVMKIRMVPVDQLFRRFPRIVRDVARQSGKDVELIIQGADTDLDKGILDSVAEPLMHILRNAVGHGIETPAERTRAGKRAQGTLRLNAYHQGNQVVIECSDDGRGINVEKVRQRAIAQRVVNSEEAAHFTEAEALQLILRPGFSTAEEVTELSGRGIGLDVVQTVLARLKGTVQIETVEGRGTTFRLRLPLTLAILRALLFRVDHRLCALPLNAVNEITRTTESEIHEVERYEVLKLRDDVLPLLRLGSAPEIGPESARQKAFVLVIHHGERKFGVIVNELAGEEELVIKALDDQLIKTDLVSGASLLGDGRVVLILNLVALIERFMRSRSTGGVRLAGLLSNLGFSQGVAAQAHHAAGGQA